MSERDIWPRILVSACIGDAQGRVLMIRHPPSMRWHLPDGDIRRGETVADAARRSVKEDLGIAVTPDAAPFLVTETIAQGGAPHYVTLHVAASAPPATFLRIIPAAGVDHGFFTASRVVGESVLVSTLAALRARFGWHV